MSVSLPKSTNHGCLQEISVNIMMIRNSQTSKLKKKFNIDIKLTGASMKPDLEMESMVKDGFQRKFLGIQALPRELIFMIMEYLNPQQVLDSVQFISREWYEFASTPFMWLSLNEISPLSFEQNYQKKPKLVERRSKGRLYLAVNRLIGKQCIVRQVRLEVTNAGQDDGVPTSILQEVSLLNSISDSRIGMVLDSQVRGKILYLSYPYYRYNLKEFSKLYQEVAFPKGSLFKSFKKLAFELLQGLDFLHRQGIIHRKLKPDNIMVTEEEHIVITDFFLSRIVTIPHTPYTPEDPKERDRSGREARRLFYRAPELLFRKSLYTYEVDIWAAGCPLAEMILGEPLFNGDTEIEQLFKMFRLLGVPHDFSVFGSATTEAKIQFPKWVSINIAHAGLKHSSKEFKKLCDTMIPHRESALHRLMKLGLNLGPKGMDLLQTMLSLDPQSRPTAKSLLQHPFFTDTTITVASIKFFLAKHDEDAIICVWNTIRKNEKLYNPQIGYMEKLKRDNAVDTY